MEDNLIQKYRKLSNNIIRSEFKYQPNNIVNMIITNLDLLDQIKLAFTSKKLLNKIKIKNVTDNLNILTDGLLIYIIM